MEVSDSCRSVDVSSIDPATLRWGIAFPVNQVLEVIVGDTGIEDFVDHEFLMAINWNWRRTGLVSIG